MWQVPAQCGPLSETVGANVVATGGTGIPASATTAGARGAWTNLGTPTTIDYHTVCVCAAQSDYGAVRATVDLGISIAGSVQLLAESLMVVPRGTAASEELSRGITLPLFVPKSSQLVAAGRAAATTAATVEVAVTGFGPSMLGLVGGSRIIPLGVLSGTTMRGTAIDPGGTAHVKGTITNIASGNVPANLRGLLLMLGVNADVARAGSHRGFIDIYAGSSSSRDIIVNNLPWTFAATLDMPMPVVVPVLPCSVASGQGLWARASCSSTTSGDRTFDLIAYGVL